MANSNAANTPANEKEAALAAYWAKYAQQAQEESGGGGGIFGYVTVETGYKVYAGGATGDQSWFPDGPTDETKDAAKKTAHAFAVQSGLQKAEWGIQTRVRKDGALSRGARASWQNDQYLVVNAWSDAASQIVVPALRECGIVLPWSGYAHIAFKPDPRGTKRKDDPTKDKMIAYVVATYATEAEMIKDAVDNFGFDPNATAPSANGSSSNGAAIPAGFDTVLAQKGWTSERWALMVETKFRPKHKLGMTPADLAEMYDVPEENIRLALGLELTF